MRICIFVIISLVSLLSTRKALSQTNPYVYGSPNYWMAQGSLDIQAGKWDSAYVNLQKAQKGYSEVGDALQEIKAIDAMGSVKSNMGEWRLADEHYHDALQKAIKCHEETTLSQILVEMLAFYKKTGNIRHYNISLGMLDSLFNATNSPQVKTNYHIYRCNEYLAQKEYTMSEHHLQQCRDVMEELPYMEREWGKLFYAYNMTNQKTLQKKYDDAIMYAKDYIRQTQILDGRNSAQQYQAYSILVAIYEEIGDRENAIACLDSIENGVGYVYQDKSIKANFYNIKGNCYAKFKDYDKAIEYFKKAYQLLKDKRTEDTPVKYSILQNMAEAYFLQKRYDEAYDAYIQCIKTSKNKFGSTSGEYYQTLYTLANIEGARGNTEMADSLFCVSVSYLQQNMKSLWKITTPSQRENIWKEALNGISGMASFAIKCGMNKCKLTEVCYNSLLFSKALLLETEKSVLDIIRDEATSEDATNYQTLLALNSRLMALKSNYEYNCKEIDSLTICARNLEYQLTEKCQSYKDFCSFLDVDYHTVKESLSNNEVLMDFSDYYQEDDSVHQYTAYVVCKNQEYPLLVKCFEQKQLDSLLNDNPNYALYDYGLLKTKATELLWKPLQGYANEGCTVYYVPSGVVHGISLESLPLADGTVLGEHYNFVRLSSAREISRRKGLKPTNKTASLYGGLQYSLSGKEMEEESNVYEKTDLAWITRSEFGTAGFKNLPKTKVEIESIEQTLTQNSYSVSKYMGAKGNAESFMSMSGHSPSIIHLATHGFYYTPEQAKTNEYFNGYTDAMSLSGLVFAGGNAAWLGKQVPAGVMGGILTARDISNLNFKNTDLVVLSACQTAQGQVTSEGLYGLQRAFKKAGAGTLVMTLWKVRDSVAEFFATTFYQELFTHKGNKRSAFEATKNKVREKYDSPYDWACFIMVD